MFVLLCREKFIALPVRIPVIAASSSVLNELGEAAPSIKQIGKCN